MISTTPKLKFRPNADEYLMAMACVIASRGTCIRRRVGCILVDENNHTLATGYNGPPSRSNHCNPGHVCGPAALAPAGQSLASCAAVHAEQNALLQCYDVSLIRVCYTTTSPCEHCVKMLLNTACERIVFLDAYPGEQARQWWLNAGREWDEFLPSEQTQPINRVFEVHKDYQRLYGPENQSR